MPTTLRMVARGMIFFGLRDSSPYMAVDSNPTQDQNAKNRPSPALAPTMPSAEVNAPSGLRVSPIDQSLGAATVDQNREGAERQHDDLGDQEDAEHLGGDVDVEVREHGVRDDHQ